MKKTAVITGGSRGIGAAICFLLAKNGYNVVVNYHHSHDAAKAVEAMIAARGESALAVYADVSRTEDIQTLFETASERFGSIDVLVNNAGISRQQVLSDITDADLEELMSVNFGSVFKCCREVLPYMLRNHSGSIINISSIWGICGASCESLYAASKAAIIGFSKSLAKELGPSGIRVNCVAPGMIDTEMNAHLSTEDIKAFCDETPIERIGTAQEVASAVLFLSGESSSFTTGQVLNVDGGYAV